VVHGSRSVMATVEDLLGAGARQLPQREGIPDPRRESTWLLAHAWGVDELWLRLRPHAQVPGDVTDRFLEWVERRAAGEPAQHLTGSCVFWNRGFTVSPEVLVPRPESELIVRTALELPLSASARVLDVGTGSGCLAITLAAERPEWRVVAVDRSLAALQVARGNRDQHRVEVVLACGDLMSAVSAGFDLVVANLPYIPSDRLAQLPPEVGCDPRQALDGGADGLLLIRRALADLPRLLTSCGGAVLELGEEQLESVVSAAHAAGLAVARRVRDVGGCDRVIVLQRR
jgi:release factor glutamine methyltransferase